MLIYLRRLSVNDLFSLIFVSYAEKNIPLKIFNLLYLQKTLQNNNSFLIILGFCFTYFNLTLMSLSFIEQGFSIVSIELFSQTLLKRGNWKENLFYFASTTGIVSSLPSLPYL